MSLWEDSEGTEWLLVVAAFLITIAIFVLNRFFTQDIRYICKQVYPDEFNYKLQTFLTFMAGTK